MKSWWFCTLNFLYFRKLDSLKITNKYGLITIKINQVGDLMRTLLYLNLELTINDKSEAISFWLAHYYLKNVTQIIRSLFHTTLLLAYKIFKNNVLYISIKLFIYKNAPKSRLPLFGYLFSFLKKNQFKQYVYKTFPKFCYPQNELKITTIVVWLLRSISNWYYAA